MKVKAYKEIFKKDSVAVYQYQTLEIDLDRVMSDDIGTIETYSKDEAQIAIGYHYHRRISHAKFTIELNGELHEIEGFIYSPTTSVAVRFACNHVRPKANSDDEFEKMLYEFQDSPRTEEMYNIIESRFDQSHSKMLQNGSRNIKQIHINGKNWFVYESSYQRIIIDQTPVRVAGHQIPVTRYASINSEEVVIFDGQEIKNFTLTQKGVKRKLQRLKGGTIYERCALSLLHPTHLVPHCWLRIPSHAEFEQAIAAGLSAPPPLPAQVPKFANITESTSVISLDDPSAIPVISDPHEVIGVLSRINDDLLIGDISPDMPSETSFHDEPSFCLLYTLSDIDEI